VLTHYDFVTNWRVRGTCEQVSEVLSEALELKRWWPAVYLDVKELKPGDPKTGVGREIELFTKGWLPYTLRWSFTVTENRHPHGFTLVPHGDFEGQGVWTFSQDGEWTDIRYDWSVEAVKPLLRALSPVMKPLLEANHHWAMARGEESLVLELARRRAQTPEGRSRVPAPPPPTFRRRPATTA
jgi:hypothetical protein